VSSLVVIAASAGNGIASAGEILVTITGGNEVASAGNAVAGNGVGAAASILGYLEMMVNGILTLLPIVPTILNRKPTTVSVADMIVNGAPALLPVVNDGACLLAGLNGGGAVRGEGEC
jgi:hypothetical protein